MCKLSPTKLIDLKSHLLQDKVSFLISWLSFKLSVDVLSIMLVLAEDFLSLFVFTLMLSLLLCLASLLELHERFFLDISVFLAWIIPGWNSASKVSVLVLSSSVSLTKLLISLSFFDSNLFVFDITESILPGIIATVTFLSSL